MQWLQPYGIQHLLVFVHHHCLIHIPVENNLKLDEIVADFGICIRYSIRIQAHENGAQRWIEWIGTQRLTSSLLTGIGPNNSSSAVWFCCCCCADAAADIRFLDQNRSQNKYESISARTFHQILLYVF